jgi:glutamate--cysteine ligase
MRSVESLSINTVSTAIEPPLSEAAAEAWIPRTCFKNGPPRRVGVEVELLVADTQHRQGLAAHYPRHRYPALLDELGREELDGRLTVEPGGQVELSSRPGSNLPNAINSVRQDLAELRRRAARHGAALVGIGVDPIRPSRRITDEPRYVAMERYLDGWGPAGRTMMCSTASVQVNVEAGIHPAEGVPRDAPVPVPGFAERWDLLHAIGPALVAAFANSPRRDGRLTGWKSTRQAVWLDLDPARVGVPPRTPGEDLPGAWTRWALDAPLMMIRRSSGSWTAPAGLTFRTWLQLGRAAVPDRPPATADDLAYHLTTLFPQVRPKGYLEVRFIDAQPGQWWSVPPAVIAAVLDDEDAADGARAAVEPVAGRWREAARVGLDDPELRRAAARTLHVAAAALRRRPDHGELAGQVDAYLERWTARGRCPADDPPQLTSDQDTISEQGDEPS